MTLDEYELTGHALYGAFATAVSAILGHAIAAAGLPRPQSIQARAKEPSRLRSRVAETGHTDSAAVEQLRRDLAGVRLIFYTNHDARRFLESGLLRRSFDVEPGATRVHHPRPEDAGAEYRAHHYTIRLNEARSALPEYARFAGLRCEVQIQTILNHAWSETTHDILYKPEQSSGFGGAMMQRLEERARKIMAEYLVPAGYEFERIQHDYRRLLKGKALFDRDALDALAGATDNNARHNILTQLRDVVFPNYDDLPAIHPELLRALLATARAARDTPDRPIETVLGSYSGRTADDVVALVAEIATEMRYVDPRGTLCALMTLSRNKPDAAAREKITEAAKRLAAYDLSVWRKVGPGIQNLLVTELEAAPDTDVDGALDVALAVWREVLRSDIREVTSTADSMTFGVAAIEASDDIRRIRAVAIDSLFAAFDRAREETTRTAILDVANAATILPTQARYANAFLALTLTDAARIVEYAAARVAVLSDPLKQTLEHRFHYELKMARCITADPDGKFGCRAEAAALSSAILAFRDLVDQDQAYARYKVLVGIDPIFPQHWTDPEFDFARADAYRRDEADRYIDEIDATTQSEWLRFLEHCVATESRDLATFWNLGRMLEGLACRKPDVAELFVASGNRALLSFLPALLNGLSVSDRPEMYRRVLGQVVAVGEYLGALVRHWRHARPTESGLIEQVLTLAMIRDDVMAVGECAIFALENAGSDIVPPAERFLRPALRYLIAQGAYRWIRIAWYSPQVLSAFDTLSEADARLVLDSLVPAPQIEPGIARAIGHIAAVHPAEVWGYLGARLDRECGGRTTDRYEAIPFELSGLRKPLARDPCLALERGRAWFGDDGDLFRFRGGKLLCALFRQNPEGFAPELERMIAAGSEADALFAAAAVRNDSTPVTDRIEIIGPHSDLSTGRTIHPVSTDSASASLPPLRSLVLCDLCVEAARSIRPEPGWVPTRRPAWLPTSRTSIAAAADQRQPGLRTIAFERRAVIVYRLTETDVEITNAFHGGRDHAALYRRAGPETAD